MYMEMIINNITDASLRLTGARLRRVLMPCLLFTSSVSFSGLNMNEAPPDFEAGGRHPCLFSYVWQVVHNKGLSRPPWCQSLEAVPEKIICFSFFLFVFGQNVYKDADVCLIK